MGTHIQCANPLSIPTSKDDFNTLPHLGSRIRFKQDMKVIIDLVTKALATKGITYPYCTMHTCINAHGLEHIGGPVHYKALWCWLETQRGISYRDTRMQCWQTWCFPGGGLAFNHLDGAVEVWNGSYPAHYDRNAHRALPNIVSYNTRALRPPPPPPPSPPADSTVFSERTRTQEPLFDRCCRTQIELDDLLRSVRDLALTELSAGRGVQMMLGKAPVTQPQAPPVMMPSRVCSPVEDRRSVTRSLELYSEAHQRYVVAPERAHLNQSSLYHSQENACPVPCRHPSHMLHLDSFTQPNVARSPTSGDNSAGASSQSVFRPKACAPSTHLKLGIDDKVEGQWNGEWLPGKVYDISPNGTITVQWDSEETSTQFPSCKVRRRVNVTSASNTSGVWL